MSISFVVETGTGSATATSYATVAQFRQYWINRGVSHDDNDPQIQGYLNSATEYIDITFTFRGEKTSTTQALEWPRHGLSNYEGYSEYDSNEIPQRIIDAVCYMAAQAKAGDLNPIDEGIKSESYGPVSKAYAKTSGQRTFPACEKLLRNLIVSGNQLVRVN